VTLDEDPYLYLIDRSKKALTRKIMVNSPGNGSLQSVISALCLRKYASSSCLTDEYYFIRDEEGVKIIDVETGNSK
jgi:hypothetical protein